MENEMIERVARAQHRAHYERGRRLYPDGAWELLDRFQRENWLFSARAAIEAMREPSEAMSTAGKHAVKGCDSTFERDIAETAYAVMIDAALSSSPASEPST